MVLTVESVHLKRPERRLEVGTAADWITGLVVVISTEPKSFVLPEANGRVRNMCRYF